MSASDMLDAAQGLRDEGYWTRPVSFRSPMATWR